MFKNLIAVATFIYAMTGYATEYDKSIYISPKFDFVNQLNSEASSDFGLGYALDIGLPVYRFASIENTLRYIYWSSEQFDNNFLQYGALLKLNFPFTDKTNFALSGGLLADLDVGNEARGKEVNPYVKLDVDYNINNNWAVVLGFNQAFSSDYQDQYAFSLGVKYKFYKVKAISEPQPVYGSIVKVEDVVKPISEGLRLVEPIVEDVQAPNPVTKQEEKTAVDYILKEGDYIYRICRHFNMSFHEFLMINKDYFVGRDLNYVYPGEVVKIKNPNK